MMTEGDLKEAARVIVNALNEQIDLPRKLKDRELKKRNASVTEMALIGVSEWIEKRFLGDSSPPEDTPR